jgi:hypothetical protein
MSSPEHYRREREAGGRVSREAEAALAADQSLPPPRDVSMQDLTPGLKDEARESRYGDQQPTMVELDYMRASGVNFIGGRIVRSVRWTLATGAVAAVLLAPGCGPFGTSADEMRDGAATLVPPGARVIGREDGDCIQLADSPSCHRILFVGPAATLEVRVDLVRAAADEAGWDLKEELRTEGATFLELSRGELDADVSLWADFRAVRCRKRPDAECADSVRILR